MNFPKFQDLVEKRTGFKTMENPTASGEYFSDSCGDLYTFYLKVTKDRIIEEVSFFTTGCGFGTATSSILVELAHGKTIEQALAITEDDIEAALDGYPEKKKDYPGRSLAALKAAIENFNANPNPTYSDGSTLGARGEESKERHAIEIAPQVVKTGEKLTISLH